MTDGEIARLLEGDQKILDNAGLLEHLRSCKFCLEILQDSAKCRWLLSSETSAFDSTKEYVDIGKALVSHETSTERIRRDEKQSKSGWFFNRYRRFCAAVVVLVASFFIVLWAGVFEHERDPELSSEIITPVRIAVETASTWGKIMFPECEPALGTVGSIYRSGYVPLNDSLRSSLKYLYKAHLGGNSSSTIAYWLGAGYLATGQTDAARNVASYARKQYPNDPKIATLDALVSYFTKDYDRSHSILDDILQLDPNDSIARINLAIVLDDQGHDAEAREILTRILERHAGTPLAERAQSILSDLSDLTDK